MYAAPLRDLYGTDKNDGGHGLYVDRCPVDNQVRAERHGVSHEHLAFDLEIEALSQPVSPLSQPDVCLGVRPRGSRSRGCLARVDGLPPAHPTP